MLEILEHLHLSLKQQDALYALSRWHPCVRGYRRDRESCSAV